MPTAGNPASIFWQEFAELSRISVHCPERGQTSRRKEGVLMASFHLSRTQAHWSWNPDRTPMVRVHPGSTLTVEIANASGGQLDRHSLTADVAALDFSRVNPVTGPIWIEGAEPADAVIVEILSIDLDDWGWTANIPGFGLLADEFAEPHLRISKVTPQYAELIPGIRLPVQPFIGTIGLAPSEPGDHPLVPPGPHGGNMDMRHVTSGSRLWLPVAVPGALLSLGDSHAAQGDGEVCGTAIETSSVVTLRVHLKKGAGLATPRLESHPFSRRTGAFWVTTGIGPDLWEAARQATREMIAWIQELTGLSREDAYLVTSTAGDLAVSEIVDAPNWVMSMHMPKDILGGGGL